MPEQRRRLMSPEALDAWNAAHLWRTCPVHDEALRVDTDTQQWCCPHGDVAMPLDEPSDTEFARAATLNPTPPVAPDLNLVGFMVVAGIFGAVLGLLVAPDVTVQVLATVLVAGFAGAVATAYGKYSWRRLKFERRYPGMSRKRLKDVRPGEFAVVPGLPVPLPIDRKEQIESAAAIYDHVTLRTRVWVSDTDPTAGQRP